MKVAKPMAVVALVMKAAVPTRAITRCNALIWLPCRTYSWWYLLIRNTQLGTPITINRGGITEVSMVSL